LKFVGLAEARNRPNGVSRQELSSEEDMFLTKGTVGRNRGARRPSHPADGALLSSSTFGTLLSSQGSNAHRRQAHRPHVGAT
jgi:hypothetical protein